MLVFHPSCAGTKDTLKSPDVAKKQVRIGCTEPEGNASLDDFLNSLAIPMPIWRAASVCA